MRKLDKEMKTILDASIEGLYMTDDAMEKKLEALPDVPDLAHRLDHPDATCVAQQTGQTRVGATGLVCAADWVRAWH